MNKNFFKVALCLALCIFVAGTEVFAAQRSSRNRSRAGSTVKKKYKAVYQYNSVPLKQPQMTKSMAPGVKNYNSGNYVGAMIDFEKLIEKEPNNFYAKYYLALTYTKLGYKQKAETLYNEIAESKSNYSLSYFSKRAVTCLNNPDDEFCLGPKKASIPAPVKEEEDNIQSEDDITNFIRSGKQIHPAAMDKITRERMERKFQADMYALQHEGGNNDTGSQEE